ncbi:MAG: hypothetical protein ACJAYF_000766 [Arenicella sp.]|jgi:hypothetical protein
MKPSRLTKELPAVASIMTATDFTVSASADIRLLYTNILPVVGN